MAGDIVGELFISVGQLAGDFAVSRWKSWRMERFFDELEPEAKRAVAEIIVAAIMQDGEQSEVEKSWLEKRRSRDDDRQVVDDAIATVARALPEGSNTDRFVAFVQERASKLPEERERKKAFAGAALALVASKREGALDVATRFGAALGLTESQVSYILGTVQTHQSANAPW